jgi:N4-gp56 family major capsid protein
MADTAKTITPAEYGNVVTRTELVDAQTGGQATLAAMRLTANNMAESVEYKMILIGEAGSNHTYVGQTAEASITATDIITVAYVQRMYSILQAAGAQKPYYAVAHPHVMYDLRSQTATGGWLWTNQYGNPAEIKNGEVGMFGGFRWIESPLVTINSDAGSGTVDTYHCQFYGENAFGYGESVPPGGRMTGPFDKLARFLNIGWYGIYEFALIDTNAHRLLTCASTIGTNT